jgi:hypothetical protein
MDHSATIERFMDREREYEHQENLKDIEFIKRDAKKTKRIEARDAKKVALEIQAKADTKVLHDAAVYAKYSKQIVQDVFLQKSERMFEKITEAAMSGELNYTYSYLHLCDGIPDTYEDGLLIDEHARRRIMKSVAELLQKEAETHDFEVETNYDCWGYNLKIDWSNPSNIN